MRRGARFAICTASVLTAVVNFTACGSTPQEVDTYIGPSATSGAAGTTGASADSGVDADVNGGSNNGGSGGLNVGAASTTGIGAGGITDSCAAEVSTATLVPLDMYLMLDVSTSMLDPTSTSVSKWDAVKSALTTFLKDDASAGLSIGLQFFPIIKPTAPTSCLNDAACGDSGPCFVKFCWQYPGDTLFPCESDTDCGGTAGSCSPLAYCSNEKTLVCRPAGVSCPKGTGNKDLGTCAKVAAGTCEHTATCDIPTYATPLEPIAALPGAATAIIASIDAKIPNGQTPTGPALSGAIQGASSYAKAHPDHQVIAIMATDGLPTECGPTDIGQVATIAAKGVKATPSIDTFVIGVFGARDIAAGAPANLDTIATAGGTTKAVIVDTTKDVTSQFLAALDAIRAGKLDCTFQIPTPMNGGTLDYSEVNVQVSDSGQTKNLVYVGAADQCDAKKGGWYYDVDPAAGTPTKIVACPTSCTAFQVAKDSVEIALGCQTVVK
jgi:hypothetical protein